MDPYKVRLICFWISSLKYYALVAGWETPVGTHGITLAIQASQHADRPGSSACSMQGHQTALHTVHVFFCIIVMSCITTSVCA
jgi:hypothetical protein